MNLGMRMGFLRLAGLAALGMTAALAQTSVTFVGGQLSLTTPGSDQNVKVEVEAAVVRLFGFPGITDGTAYSPVAGVAVITGAGNDQVEFDVQSALSLDVRIDTKTGPSKTLVKWKLLAGGAAPVASLDIDSGASGERYVSVELDSETPNATVLVDAGTATEVLTKVNSSNLSDTLRVSFGAAAPKTAFELVSAASSLTADVRGGGTGGQDELVYKITQTRPATVDVSWAIESGAGDDKIEAVISAPGATVKQRGSALAQGGNDFVLFESDAFSTETGLTLNGGLGTDYLAQVIKGRFQASQTLQTVMAGGDGNDILILTTDTGIFGTGLPNDLFPIINCGPGIDQFNAFGSIRGCESRL